jgi:hypothetical protein
MKHAWEKKLTGFRCWKCGEESPTRHQKDCLSQLPPPRPLVQVMDQISFEIFARQQPDVIAAINAALDHGDTAGQIERALIKRFGLASLTAALTAGAAHYLEQKRKETH